MPHPAMQAVERYYTLFNEKDWPGITAMFDLPATITSDDVGDAKAGPTSAST
jgi:hypothetical protein